MEIALRIAPQHSTQYADMAARLAVPELLASPAGRFVRRAEPTQIGGHPYVLAEVDAEPEAIVDALRGLGATGEAFEHHASIAGRAGGRTRRRRRAAP